jgi:hypothetical protein
MEPWQSLQPMVGFTNEVNIRFDPNEMAIFLAAGEIDFMQDAMLLAERHATSHEVFRKYCELRHEISRRLPAHESFLGAVGTSHLSAKEVLALKPLTLPLNNMAEGLISGTEQDLSLCKSVVTRFGPITKKYFEDSKFPTVSFPSDEDLEKMLENLLVN